MKFTRAIGLLISLVCIGLVPRAYARGLAAVKPAMVCTSLEKMVLTNPETPGVVESATVSTVGPGQTTLPGQAAATSSATAPYCDVKGYVAPQIRFELHLPMETWTQRMLFLGCGGYCGYVRLGTVPASEGCLQVTNGQLAIVSSDLGHEGGGAVWAANKDLRQDFGFLGVHLTTLAAKEIIARFYGQPQAYAYFSGCSDGGREGMMEAQRYPADYNGILAGAPVIEEVENNTVYHAWIYQHLRSADGTDVLSERVLSVLHAAALATCGTIEGTKQDGIIADPSMCSFDPAVVACKSGQTDGECLSPAQVKVARDVYRGAELPNGKALYPGFEPGSEMNWNQADRAGSSYPGGFPGYMASDPFDPKADYTNLKFTAEAVQKQRVFVDELNAVNPNLGAFQKAGGKLIIWHGWNDTLAPPKVSVQFVREVRRVVGPSVDSFVRLYMLPGVNHCGRGDGPDKIDALSPLMDWVEDGTAPDRLTARKVDTTGRVILEHTIQPYK